MIKVDPSKIFIERAIVYNSQIKIDTELIWDEFGEDQFSFSFHHDLSFNLKENKIRLRLNALIEMLNGKNQLLDAKAEFDIEFIFLIENFKELHIKTNKEINIDPLLGTTLISIAYSTARGMILQQTQNSLFGGIILPIISPNKIPIKK